MGRGSTVFLVVIGVVLVGGAIAPGLSPVTATSPVSDSMEPTASTDSLVLVLNTSPEPGDIILFESPQHDNQVLHRVIEESDAGYITQGDANELPDQEVGMQPVSQDSVSGTVPTIAGYPVVIPYGGVVFTNPIVLLGAWGLLSLSLLYTTKVGEITRGKVTRIPIRKYAVVIAIIVMIGMPVATAFFAVPVQTEIVTSTIASPASEDIAAPGGTSERVISVSSPFFSVLRTSPTITGDLIVQNIDNPIGAQTTEITVQNPPSDTPVIHESEVVIYSYPNVLPAAISAPVETVHPVLASFLNSVIIGAGIIIIAFLFDKQQIIRSSQREIKSHRQNRGT